MARPRRTDVKRDAGGRILASSYRLGRDEKRAALETRARDEQALAVWRRTLDQIQCGLIDPRLGTKLGRMFVIGDPLKISPQELEAGTRFAKILDDYDRLVLGKHRSAQAQDIMKTRGAPADIDNVETVHRTSNGLMTCLRVLGGNFIMSEGLGTVTRTGLCAATEMLCRNDDFVSDYKAAKAGLRLLADHFGLYDTAEGRIAAWHDPVAKEARTVGIVESWAPTVAR
jgi:hypothetical protein